MNNYQGKPGEDQDYKDKTITLRQLINPSGCFTVCLLLTLGLTWSSKLISNNISSAIWIFGGIITFLAIPVSYLVDRMLINAEKKAKIQDEKQN